MKDPYETLGVTPTATEDAIRKAYRALAKKLHPDLNPGVASAEERFKEVSNAYELIGDPVKRTRFDKGELDASGAERPARRHFRDFDGQGGTRDPYETAGFADLGASDIFAEMFGRRARGFGEIRGDDARYQLVVTFLDAINGAIKRLTLPDGGSLDLKIPPGAQDGLVLRLRGKGAASTGSGEAGDAIVELSVTPHRFFTRQGDDIHLELPVTLTEAVMGARVKAPTPTGAVMLTVPKGANSGVLLRLKGRGAPRREGHGDEIIRLKIVLPTEANVELETFLSTWEPGPGYDPRSDMQS